MSETFVYFVAICAVLALIIFMPWLLFWALKVLFGTAIPFTLKTWAAGWVLLIAANAVGNGNSK